MTIQSNRALWYQKLKDKFVLVKISEQRTIAYKHDKSKTVNFFSCTKLDNKL